MDFVVSRGRALRRANRSVQEPSPEAPPRPRGVGRGLRGRVARRLRTTPTSGSCTRRASKGGPTCATGPRRLAADGRSRPHRRRPRPRGHSTPHCCTRTTRCSGCTPRPPRAVDGARARVQRLRARRVRALPRAGLFRPAPIPLTDLDDAVTEVERVAALGARAVILPAVSPIPYSSRALDPVWAAAQANGMLVAFHVATGGVKVGQDAAPTLQGMIATARTQNHDELDDELIRRAAHRRGSDGEHRAAADRRVAGRRGVLERFPALHFVLVEFNAYWLVSTMAAMDKAWTLGVGQFRDWWAGTWDDARADDDQPGMAQLFRLNERWPYPLMPSELRAATDPRLLSGRPLPPSPAATSPARRRSCGARTTPTPRARSCTPERRSTTSSATSSRTSEARSSAARSARCSASRLPRRHEQHRNHRGPLLRPVRRRHRRRPLPRLSTAQGRGAALLQRAPRLLRGRRADDVERVLADHDTFFSGVARSSTSYAPISRCHLACSSSRTRRSTPGIARSSRGLHASPRDRAGAEDPRLRRPQPRRADRCRAGSTFIADLGAQLPMRTIGMLLGIPEADQTSVPPASRQGRSRSERASDQAGRGLRQRCDVRRLHRLARASTRPTT